MQRLPLVALLAMSISLVCARAADTTPFALNGWQFHDYNIPKLEEAVLRAPEYGVNFLIFSHEFFRSTEGFLASADDLDPQNPPAYLQDLKLGGAFQLHRGWHGDMRKIAALATERNIPYYLWLHEFNDIPKRFLKDNVLQMDDPGLFPFLDDRYSRLLKILPDTAGFVITFHESDYLIFRNREVASSADVPERIYRVLKYFYDFLHRHNKQLIVRNFFYEPLEMEYFKKALNRLPDDIISMSKDTTHEFHPFYPWDPQHGQSGGKRQIIEIDLGVEKAWSSQGAYAQTDYIRRVAQRARDTKLAGLVGRARMIGDKPLQDTHEVNLYAFSRYLANPNLGVDAVLHDWAAKRGFAPGAVPHIASAMKRSEFINHHGRWHLGNWFTKLIGAEWADYSYYYGHVLERARSKWTNDPADRALEEKLYHPDAETYRQLVAEKDEVVAQVRAGLADLVAASRYATAESLAPFEENYRFLQDAALLQREWVRAYFSMRRFMDNPKAEYRITVEDALTKLELYERTPGISYGLNMRAGVALEDALPKLELYEGTRGSSHGLNVNTGRRYNIDAFVIEMRWRMANRQRAIAEDKQILDEVRRRIDVAKN
ncbi:MAG: hypothetical protein ACREH8_09905 [Opitutaceae bacterium]